MTDQEKKEIIAEVESSIMEKMKGKCIKEDTQSALSTPRNKWFSHINKPSLMHKEFGNYAYWQVWENVRKLTCLICGVGYCRQLVGNEDAEEIAEKMCQFVYDLRKEKLESEERKCQNQSKQS